MSSSIHYLDELEELLQKLGIPKEEVCIVGSASMAYHELKPNNDLDIVILPQTRKRLFNTDNTLRLAPHVELVKKGWTPNPSITDEMIVENPRYHFLFRGFKIVRLELLLAKKRTLDRPKDRKDIEAIENYRQKKAFDKDLYEEALPPPNRLPARIVRGIKNRLRPYWRQWLARHWTRCASEDMLIMQHTDKLLSYQFNGRGEFNRYDTIVRYLAAEHHYGLNDFGFDLYRKMQRTRDFVVEEEAVERYKKLIDSVKEEGFDEYSALPVDRDQKLMDGSHRLALALFFDQKLLALKPSRQAFSTDFSLGWFKTHGFTDRELEILEEKRQEIFQRKGIYFQVILWPPAGNFFDRIERELSERFRILRTYTKAPGERFEEAVFRIYSSDDIEAWKIRKKLKGFDSYDKLIHVIEIEIPNPTFRKKALNNHDICVEVESLKKEFRERYRTEVPGYFYDIIMHIGDNFHHTREIAKVLEKLPDA